MTNPTTYFGWQMPEPTDLVTDLPADFEVFGQAVDTDLQDLLGGTTGQVLSKTSGTDLDFTWVDPTAGDITGVTAGTGISGGGTSGTVTVTNSMATAIDAKGDLIAGTADDTFSRLAIGANDTVLTADSSEATGLKWVAPSSGAMTLIQRSTFTSVAGTSTTFDGIFTSTYKSYQVMIERIGVPTAASAEIRLQMRVSGADATTSYNGNTNFGSHNSNTVSGDYTSGAGFFMLLPGAGGDSDNTMSAGTLFFNKVGTGSNVQAILTGLAYATYNSKNHFIGCKTTVGIDADGFRLYSTGGNITGTIAIYGLAV
jgi:hypothetical protein